MSRTGPPLASPPATRHHPARPTYEPNPPAPASTPSPRLPSPDTHTPSGRRATGRRAAPCVSSRFLALASFFRSFSSGPYDPLPPFISRRMRPSPRSGVRARAQRARRPLPDIPTSRHPGDPPPNRTPPTYTPDARCPMPTPSLRRDLTPWQTGSSASRRPRERSDNQRFHPPRPSPRRRAGARTDPMLSTPLHTHTPDTEDTPDTGPPMHPATPSPPSHPFRDATRPGPATRSP